MKSSTKLILTIYQRMRESEERKKIANFKRIHQILCNDQWRQSCEQTVVCLLFDIIVGRSFEV